MPLRFKNSRSRLDRAYVHYRAFLAEWNALFEDKSPITNIRNDKNTGWGIVSIQPPPEWIERAQTNEFSLVIGEIAYQLRSALDGLMWDAVTHIQGTEPPADTNSLYFPILSGKKTVDDCGFDKIPLPDKLIGWLKSVQPGTADKPLDDPDSGLQNTLEDIHNLARFDRHRRLRVVGVIPFTAKVWIDATMPPGGSIVSEEWIECDLLDGKYDFLRLKIEVSGMTPYYIRLKTKLAFEIWVEDVPRYDSTDIGGHLCRYIQAVERVIDRFEQEFS